MGVLCVALVFVQPSLLAQTSGLSPNVREFVSVDAPVVALMHVRVIDGSGADDGPIWLYRYPRYFGHARAPFLSGRKRYVSHTGVQLPTALPLGFTLPEAIKIATANGAELLGESSRIGTVAPGKQADIVVIKGNPMVNIADIEKVEIVFKDGVGYDSAKLIASVKGLVGLY